MIGELATAIANGLTSSQLMYAMRAHPTFNEAISCAVENSRSRLPDGSGCKTDPISIKFKIYAMEESPWRFHSLFQCFILTIRSEVHII